MHLHILGICGTFMGGLAAIAKAAGHTVTGCDANVYPPMSTQLAALGIDLTEGYEAVQLDGDAGKADLFVVGNAVRRGMPLIEAILDRGLPYTSGPEWLRDHVLAGRLVLAVAGTHGKTTTASMLAWILEHAGLAPGFLIGGVPLDFGVSARHSDSAFFVIEADEYDTAFFDKRSKFVHYRPRTAILNNLEFDHADIFPDLAAIETQFHHFVRTIPAAGKLVVNAEEASLARVLARGCWSDVERFAGGEIALDGPAPDWRIGTDGKVLHAGAPQGHVRWPEDSPLTGRHNRLNALAAIAAARHAGVPVDASLAALASFRGVKRRMEVRGVARGVTVYDDFAHHPTAIATTVAGLRRRVGTQRIVAVLEPRSNTMKLGTMKAQLPGSLAEADHAFCYAHGLGWDPREALAPLGFRHAVHDDLDALVDAIAAYVRPGDHVLVMSNGGFGGVHAKLLAKLAGAAPSAAPPGR
jgi:UDP-N-acetylmuramate: L-alanyl-gamma-D-glutamyl-meso-diaminopimelate ligase